MNRFLMWVTRRLPYRPIRVDGRDYLERYHVLKAFGITVYLHRYLNSDGDRDVHDHPWKWAVGIPLCGGYLEERHRPKWTGIKRYKWRWIGRFRPNFISGTIFHRIAAVEPLTWTLFIHGPRTKEWGFMDTSGRYRPAVYSMNFSGWHKTAGRRPQ